jgi:hypothetical protein
VSRLRAGITYRSSILTARPLVHDCDLHKPAGLDLLPWQGPRDGNAGPPPPSALRHLLHNSTGVHRARIGPGLRRPVAREEVRVRTAGHDRIDRLMVITVLDG